MATTSSRGTAKTPWTSRLQSDGCSFTSAGGQILYCKFRLIFYFCGPLISYLRIWLTKRCSLKEDYPLCMREQLGDRLPSFSPSEWTMLREAETDFYGMNYYTSQFARGRTTPPALEDFTGNIEESQENKQGKSVGKESGLHWLRSSPNLFRKHLTRVYRLYRKPIYITENGCPCPGEDKMTRDESINDPYRVGYFESHLDAVAKSVSEDGSDIRGYFAWSLMDNLGALRAPSLSL